MKRLRQASKICLENQVANDLILAIRQVCRGNFT